MTRSISKLQIAFCSVAVTKCKSLVYESSDGASNTELLSSRELYTQTWTPCLGEELAAADVFEGIVYTNMDTMSGRRAVMQTRNRQHQRLACSSGDLKGDCCRPHSQKDLSCLFI